MSYRVLIPTAGTGSRLGLMTRFINKSLVGIANRPTICHIIEQFSSDAEFVIALGHKGNLVREFLTIAYPERKFFFSEVSPFEGEGSGLGLSVLSCKNHLQQPFIFISCDTLIKEPIPDLSDNWMGFAEVSNLDQYRTLEIQQNTIKGIFEKGFGKITTHKAYIGLAGIKDFKNFWHAMEYGGNEAILTGEAFGMQSLLNQRVKAYKFTWFDTGNIDALEKTREAYREPNEPNILEKANEAIWFVGKKAIKFSDDKKFIANRVQRAKSISDFIPTVMDVTSNMYSYTKIDGKVLSEIITIPLFEKLLEYSKTFWEKQNLIPEERQNFVKGCMNFYKAKTRDRIDLFFNNFDKKDGTEAINGVQMPTIKELLDKVNWNWLADGLPGRFHGDFHFENILFSSETNKFTFLDWRQEYAGSLTTGDIYYDLAKLLHGMIVCHELIAENHFTIEWLNDEISFNLLRKQILVQCEQYYYNWLDTNGYDKKKVHILTALIYLNIAALHHFPYSLMLYALGKEMLYHSIGE